MNAEASRIIVVDNHCGACGTDNVQVYHEHFPELRIMAASSEEAAKRLVTRLETSLNAVSDPFHGDPVRQAIADVQAFVNREGAAHPRARSLDADLPNLRKWTLRKWERCPNNNRFTHRQ